MDTEGVTIAFTIMLTVLDTTVEGTAQVALDVSAHVTISPFAKPEELNALLLIPTLLPFTCH
jgi:hypothetical protein